MLLQNTNSDFICSNTFIFKTEIKKFQITLRMTTEVAAFVSNSLRLLYINQLTIKGFKKVSMKLT